MPLKIKCNIFLQVFLFSSNCLALNGNELLTHMQSSDSGHEIASAAYASAVYDAVLFHSQVIDHDNRLNLNICIPPKVTVGQVRDVIKKFLINNPGRRHTSAYSLSYVALMTEWPCQNESTQ